MMKMLVLVPLLIAVLLEIGQTSSCPSAITLNSELQCQALVVFEEDCRNFNILNCTFRLCEECSERSRGTMKECSLFCCGNPNILNSSINSLQGCKTSLQPKSKQKNTAKDIGIAIASIFISLLIMGIAMSCICRKRGNCLHIQQRNINLHKKKRIPNHHDLPASVDRLHSHLQNGSWILMEQRQYPLIGSICTVCLDNRPSMELICNHVFHRKCLLECLKRKKQCINCRSNKVRDARVFCESCFRYFVQIKIQQQIENLKVGIQLCTNCQIKQMEGPQ